MISTSAKHSLVYRFTILYVQTSLHIKVSIGTINIRIDDELKERAFSALEKLGVSPSEALRQMLEYVATNGALPFKPVLLTAENEVLITLVKERLASSRKGIEVSLDDL
ncbi:type II toxin-antitoxin system RelB/DinJ family antitoxin [Shewanella sp. PP-He15 brown]|uniref:type II toxin-antitoxin system RelB/DinJ family antitoxin n=1 Tax=Shewanella baltica TaxID=62322 RepID=UPI000AFEA9C6|nr:type II toxin-antitoxin system RelB/DinJ family antitoxin [Shewanella baltica]